MAAAVLGGAVLLLARRVAPRAVFMATFAIGALGVRARLADGAADRGTRLVRPVCRNPLHDQRFRVLALVVSLGSLSVWAVPTIVFSRCAPASRSPRRYHVGACNGPGRSRLRTHRPHAWAVADQVRAATDRAALAPSLAARPGPGASGQEPRSGALEERQRIAREMHDIVAHGISVMIVQADGLDSRLLPTRRHRLGPWRPSQRPGGPRWPRCADSSVCSGIGGRPARMPRPDAGRCRRSGRAGPSRWCAGDLLLTGAATTPPEIVRTHRIPHRSGGADQRSQTRGAGRSRQRPGRHRPEARSASM